MMIKPCEFDADYNVIIHRIHQDGSSCTCGKYKRDGFQPVSKWAKHMDYYIKNSQKARGCKVKDKVSDE